MAKASQPLDIEALVSRVHGNEFRPARVALLTPNESYAPNRSETTSEVVSYPVEGARKKSYQQELQASKVVHALVTKTPQFTETVGHEIEQDGDAILRPLIRAPPRKDTRKTIPPEFHEIEISNWERNIIWEQPSQKSEDVKTPTPLELWKRPRNPHLDDLDLDAAVVWPGDEKRKRQVPLILELGVAGRSVANWVLQNDSRRNIYPTSALKTQEYQNRVRASTGQNITSTAVLNPASTAKKSLHQDKDQMEAFIEKRQELRAQMAKDKTSRITQAMGNLAFSGRGRTITSSLMGPGGTERSGRPTRDVHSGMEAEYIEQLELVASHGLVRDLSKVMLRQYHRPKLPLVVVRPDLMWQCQVRHVPPTKKEGGFVGMHAGAASHAKLRTEADLSPTEGKLVLMEYCEERPLVQLTKGMASKIINYYRGDRAQCPVSAGGGDRPARRKREEPSSSSSSTKTERLPRLKTAHGKGNIMDWVGKIPKRTSKERAEQESIDILPEGVTEILHPKVHGPFIGEVVEGQTITGLVTNMFVAPMFRHSSEPTDFLLVLTPPSGAARPGQRDYMGVVLRDLPENVYTIGQVEPRVRVNAPQSPGERNFVGPYISYQIARALTRSQAREGHGLRFDELQHTVCPNLEIQHTTLRQRLKSVAIFDKNTSIWTTKQIGMDEYLGVEALGKTISPESIAAFEIANAATRRLEDLGIHELYAGTNSAVSVGVAVFYVKAQLSAIRELSKQMEKMIGVAKTNKTMTKTKLAFYEAAAVELDQRHKELRQKIEVAQFIYEQLQLAPWHLTGDFIDTHIKGEGTGMIKLTGLGDPSGNGEGYSFLREADAKPSKSVGNAALSAQAKKITGTEDDLRKLTMKEMASLLRSYGLTQKKIDTLKRWDRVHVIRDLSTKAASDGIGDGLERFARGEKMKLSEQKQMYRDRIRVIWRRQIAALSMDEKGTDVGGDTGAAEGQQQQSKKKSSDNKNQKGESGSDSDDEDDDFFAAELEDEMMDREEANQLVADRAGATTEGGTNRGQIRAAIQDKELTKDARELAALKRQREEERAAEGGLQPSFSDLDASTHSANRKVIRKKVVKIFPDGKQTITFKYILKPSEVGKIQARLDAAEEQGQTQKQRPFDYALNSDERPPGQATWEDDDDIEYAPGGRSGSKRRGNRGRRGGRITPKGGLQFGKLKNKVSNEERMRKRRRDEDEMDTYIPTAKRKGTSNRRERGSIRDRRPHVIFADKLEGIRMAAETRPGAGPFMKPVNSKMVPRYYEVISKPMDLSAIRDKIKRYEYRSADAMMKDFELMKNNAVKFNGAQSQLALAAVGIHEFVSNQVESSRSELASLETAVGEQLDDPKPKKKAKTTGKKKKASSKAATAANVDGFAINFGDLPNFKFDDSDSGDEVSFTGE